MAHHLLTAASLLTLALPLSTARAEPTLPLETRSASPIDPAPQTWALVEPAPDPERSGWLRHVRIRKGAGLEVRGPVDLGGERLLLSVKGPVMEHKRLGLTLELRF